jgi:hypothetical protein
LHFCLGMGFVFIFLFFSKFPRLAGHDDTCL